MVCINENGTSSGRGLAKNARDVARVALASSAPYVEADITGVACERTKADRRVVAAVYVVEERLIANGGIVAANGIAKEHTLTDGRVEAAAGIAKERERAG